MIPIALSALLGYVMGRESAPIRPMASLGFAGLVAAERATGLPISAIGLAQGPSGRILVRGLALGALAGRLGFWGAAAAHLAYEIGGAVRGDVR
jgi:hypothetical protein